MGTDSKKKHSKKKLTDAERRQQRAQNKLRNTIRKVFKRAGFVYLPTREKYKTIGGKRLEIDSAFLFENIIVFCEDTVGHKSEHLIKSDENSRIISAHFEDVLSWLREEHPDKFEQFNEYAAARYRHRFLYIPDGVIEFDAERFSGLKYVEPRVLKYFDVVTSAIKRSARYELLRYLGISDEDVGFAGPDARRSAISVNIICPNDSVGLPGDARVVSFMMAPEQLLANGYVLRKDNWEAPDSVYQRLVEPSRVAAIRRYIANNEQSFLNNIIVALPPDVQFHDKDGKDVPITDIQDYDASYTIEIPQRSSAIRIIDGQHRVLAYHEGDDALEPQISRLRGKLHLLVTGLVFPSEMSDAARAKYESQIFLDINKNAKKVSSDVLLYIEELKDPFSPEGIARRVVKLLNQKKLFSRPLQLSTLDDAGIKTTSIIKFALKGLVAIEEDPGSLFLYWDGDKDVLLNGDLESKKAEDALAEYANFACCALCYLFGGVKNAFKKEWDDPESKIESVTSINGFLLALKRSLPALGIHDASFYSERLSNLDLSFYRSDNPDESFPYASSQYSMMADYIVEKCFPEVMGEAKISIGNIVAE